MTLHRLRNLWPDGFAELQSDSEPLDDLGTTLELSDLGVRVHRIAELPEGELIDDEALVKRLLDRASSRRRRWAAAPGEESAEEELPKPEFGPSWKPACVSPRPFDTIAAAKRRLAQEK